MNAQPITATIAATVPTTPVRVVIIETDGTARVEDMTPAASGSLLDPLQTAVGGLIDVAGLGEGLDMYVHDEGFYVCEPNPVASLIAITLGGRTQPFFGPAVFTGGCDSNGYDVSISDARAAEVQTVAAWANSQPEMLAEISAHALRAVGR